MAKTATHRKVKISIYQLDGFEFGETNEWEVELKFPRAKGKFTTTYNIVGGLESEALKDAIKRVDSLLDLD
jgi:hypothetical protein